LKRTFTLPFSVHADPFQLGILDQTAAELHVDFDICNNAKNTSHLQQQQCSSQENLNQHPEKYEQEFW
jgi:hypothetical protein